MIKLVNKTILGLGLFAVGVSALADTITVENHTPYTVEVSGLVGATASANPIVANGKTKIFANGDWIGHLMVIDTGQPGYLDNIVATERSNKFSAFDLYQGVTVEVYGHRVVIE